MTTDDLCPCITIEWVFAVYTLACVSAGCAIGWCFKKWHDQEFV